MDTKIYKQKLEAEEKRLLASAGRADANAADLSAGPFVDDRSDAGVRDEEKGAQYKTLSDDSDALSQVRAALQRIVNGTFGKCLVDGGPIEEKRLQAVPWAAYCLKHEKRVEEEHPRAMPTL